MLKYGLLCIVIMSFSSYGQEIQKLHSKEKLIQVFTTAENTDLRLTLTNNLNFIPSQQPVESEISVFVNPTQSFQNFMGIGGAITDASAEVFAKLSAAKQAELLSAYYDKKNGIGYSLLRTSIHSSDFASESYTYIQEGDQELKTFSIDHDKTYRIPMISLEFYLSLIHI